MYIVPTEPTFFVKCTLIGCSYHCLLPSVTTNIQREEEREWIVTRGWRSWTIHYLTVLPDYGIAVLLQKQSVNNIFT